MDEDNLLIKKYLDGDQASLRSLIDKYTPSIFNFLSRTAGVSGASDLTQEVFIKVWKNLNSFNKDKSQFKTWLFTIARNSATDYLRKKKSIPFSLMKEDEFSEDLLEDEEILPDEVYAQIQDKETLIKILEELPNNYKQVLTLHYQEDMTFKEIGEVLGKPLNTVKSYHLRALNMLLGKLKGKF